MKKFILTAALAAALLGGCADIQRDAGRNPGADPARPVVMLSIQDGGRRTVGVQPDPLVFRAGEGPVTIVWSFPKGGKLRFAENGIVIEGETTTRGAPTKPTDRTFDSQVINREQKEIIDCRIANDGLEFTCLNRHTRPGIYKYTVRVLEDGKPLAPLDPTLMNN